MDKELILIKLEETLKCFFGVTGSVKYENDNTVGIEIVSNFFKNIIITKRIDIVSKAILDISTTDLVDYNISIIALTENEANLGLKENGNSTIVVSSGEGFAVQPPLD